MHDDQPLVLPEPHVQRAEQIWAQSSAASADAYRTATRRRSASTITEQNTEARYMNARWVRWMSTSRECPNGRKSPLQAGELRPAGLCAPSPSWYSGRL